MAREVLTKYLYRCDGRTLNNHFCQQVAVIEAISPEDADELAKVQKWQCGDRGWICNKTHRGDLSEPEKRTERNIEPDTTPKRLVHVPLPWNGHV